MNIDRRPIFKSNQQETSPDEQSQKAYRCELTRDKSLIFQDDSDSSGRDETSTSCEVAERHIISLADFKSILRPRRTS